jgi:hypothetical protein
MEMPKTLYVASLASHCRRASPQGDPLSPALTNAKAKKSACHEMSLPLRCHNLAGFQP